MQRWEARLLLRRAGAGTRPDELDVYEALSPAQGVARLLDASVNPVSGPPGSANKNPWEYADEAVEWWVHRWATDPRSLVHKIRFFFHHHLTVNRDAMREAVHTADYLTKICDHALGDYRQLVQAISITPAMLRYLDNWRNLVGKPGENFSRELLEIMLLGHGNYTQTDVEELARAWTGYTITDSGRGSYHFSLASHDDRDKTIFGITRRWKGPEVTDHIFSDPTLRVIAARHLARRMWRFLIGRDAPEAAVADCGAALISGGWRIPALVTAILTHPTAWTAEFTAPVPRTPLEWVVDLIRCTGVSTDDVNPQWFLDRLGMRPLSAATPEGYPPAEEMLNVGTHLVRMDIARHIYWRLGDSGFLSSDTLERLPVSQAVDLALRSFGVGEASTHTRRLIEDMVVEERGQRGWVERQNTVLAVMLSPEMQLVF